MTDFKSIFLNATPLIDVRAPIEFKNGHFPTSINLPILSDDERHQVGIEYRKNGQESAIKLGHQLVAGDKKQERISAWKSFLQKNPNAKLYCFRGGLRSQTSIKWLQEAGDRIELIPGGYKAMRKFLLEILDESVKNKKILLLAGKTGVGKTEFLQDPLFQAPWIDLEKHANHKGSAFGAQGILGYQPAQATFENSIAVELLKLANLPTLVLEDESRGIGAVQVPPPLFSKMLVAQTVVLERPIDERVRLIIKEYVIAKTQFFDGDTKKCETFFMAALQRIQKKLGDLHYKKIRNEMAQAFQESHLNSYESHASWVKQLLLHYYDPLYDQKLKKRSDKIVFRGSKNECLEYFRTT